MMAGLCRAIARGRSFAARGGRLRRRIGVRGVRGRMVEDGLRLRQGVAACARGARKRAVRDSGQMTIEFAVALPVLIVVAVIASNALLFFSECASFDRVAREAVRVCAASPAYGQGLEQSRAQVQSFIDESFSAPYLSSEVGVSGGGLGHATFTATLEFSPTLFGLGLRDEVFGVALPRLKHVATMTVDVYKPGVVL